MSTLPRLDRNRKRATLLPVLMVMAVGVVLLSGCAVPADEPPEPGADSSIGDRQVRLDIDRFAASPDAGMDHYVGPVDDALFVGIAVADRDASDAEPRTVAVYLCDSRDVSQWIFEEVAGQEANLEAGDTRVDVTFAEDRISGTVAMGDGEPQPFTADLATGEAGLYRASYSLGGDDYHLDWIVLADGRRRGPLDGKGNDIPPPPPPSLQ